MKVRSRAWLLALACVVVSASPAVAEVDAKAAAGKLERIRLDVAKTENEIDAIQRDFSALIAKRKEVAETLKRLKRDDQVLERKLIEVDEQRKGLVTKVDEAEKKVLAVREENSKRLRALYIQRAVLDGPTVYTRADRGEVERIAVYSRAIRESDEKRFTALRSAAEELIAARTALDASIADAQRLREEIKLMRTDAEKKQRELAVLAGEIQKKKDSAQRSLALLKKEALDLEQFIASLTQGAEEPEREDTEEETTEEVRKPDLKEERVEQGSPKIDLRGLFGARASLVAPVKGEVVQHFGKVKLASFKDVLFSKGVEFSAKENDEVHAVLAGTVAYAGELPGYDTVVIIDHGARSYSLYGRLGKCLVKKDEVVAKDHVIGTTSTTDKRGRNFYFEVRNSGKPVDPESVLPRISR